MRDDNNGEGKPCQKHPTSMSHVSLAQTEAEAPAAPRHMSAHNVFEVLEKCRHGEACERKNVGNGESKRAISTLDLRLFCLHALCGVLAKKNPPETAIVQTISAHKCISSAF